MKRTLAFFVLTVCALARTNPRTCGSGPEKRDEVRLMAEQNRRLRPLSRRAPAQAAARTVGDLVLMDAADGILSERNLFNLDERRVVFTPGGSPGTYRFAVTAGGLLGPEAADRQLTELGDDDTSAAALPFAFPYFGARYTSVWINSDGNLTFDRPDTASSDRSLGRFNAGPPRIAPLFMDLDPSRGGAVMVTATAARFTVTWLAVPEYRATGVGSPNTAQVTLYPDGRMEFVYGGVTTAEAVTGIARGRLEGSSAIVSFTGGSTAVYTSSIVERFSLGGEIDMVTLSQRFYEQFDDAYDYLVVYNNLGVSAGAGVVAFEVTVRNDRTGYGDVEVDDGAQYGSRRRLQAVLNLGPLTQYPADPNGLVPARLSARDTPLSILGHEAGHLFLAFASVRDGQNPAARPMLGAQNAHWSFAFNSEASLLEGNRIRDLGAGGSPRFETVGSSEGYSALDQYLMGLRAPEEVPPMFLVTNTSLGFLLRPPQTGVRFDGVRRDIAIEEIVAAEGRRTPDHTVAQRRYRFAFVLLVQPGVEPTAEQVAQLERYRAEFGGYYERVTDGRATAETTLRRALAFSTQPAGGVVQGATANLRVEAAGPLTLRLSARPAGIVDVPESVSIPAGSSFALVPVTGRARGVADLAAEAPGDRHERALTKIQVAAAGDLRPFVRDRDRQQTLRADRAPEPIVVRAADGNRVPYPGLRVEAVTEGAQAEPAAVTTNAAGEAEFRVRPGAGAVNEVRFRIGGGAAGERVLLAGVPVVADGGVVNAASYSPGLSPGGLAVVFGANLSAVERAAQAAFPGVTELSGTQVVIGGAAVRLLFVSDRQINFVIPVGLVPGVYEIEVRTAAGRSVAKPISVEAAWPGIFAARREGERIAVTATGLGTRLDFTARVAGREAVVESIRSLPEGPYEVMLRVPANTTGRVLVQLIAGERPSNGVEVLLF